MKKNTLPPFSRRTFIQAGVLLSLAATLRGQSKNTPPGAVTATSRLNPKFFVGEDKPLRLALVGCGGQGSWVINGMVAANEHGANCTVTALCDPDADKAAKVFEKFPDAPQYKDYRKLIAEKAGAFDAAIIATPDHMHFPIAMAMMQAGKHIYVEKPMAHTITEVLKMKETALKIGVVAEMGNHGNAFEGTRLQQEWIQAGLIGNVKEVHAWTNRPVWPQGVENWYPGQPVPETMDWNLWLGVSEKVPYNKAYAPFKWRGYFEWGAGAIGDMAVHSLDAPLRALDLRGDYTVNAEAEGLTDISWPTAARAVFDFPERNGRPALKLRWFEGQWQAPRPEELGNDEAGNPIELRKDGGCMYYGDKGILYSGHEHHAATPQLLPAEKMAQARKDKLIPPKTIPRVPRGSAYMNWMNLCRGKGLPGSDVADTAADVTIMALMGNLAMRTGKELKWDSANGRVIGLPDEFAALIDKSYRNF